jgi:hypothetical protein
MSLKTPQWTNENIQKAMNNLTGDVRRQIGQTKYFCDDSACTTVDIDGTPVTTTVVNVAYDGFEITASDGWAPYTFSVQAGTLPAGLTLDVIDGETAEIVGTPTAVAASAGIVIRATDDAGAVADLGPFTITVTAE